MTDLCLLQKLCVFSEEASGTYGENGQQMGMQMIGVTNTLVMVLVHHLWLVIMNNNFDLAFAFFFAVSFMWVWIIPAVEDANSMSPYYQTIYPTMLQSPVLWLNVLVSVGAHLVPIYAFFKYRQLFGGHPIYDETYKN